MDLTFSSKSQEFELDGSVKGTKVVLSNDEGAIYPVMLEPDKIDLTNTELEKLALDVIYQKNFRDKYENEKFKELNDKIAKYEELITKMKLSMEQSDKMVQLATATLNELINKMYPDGGATDGATEGTTDETTEEN
ncbi:DUF1366 domain-containing protein [Streptococcus lutetiensis]|uniref:DUF1366 domain-containing protein n=1 Tax=Streptococcus lutetiensis TaxID=150055 RepID=UPI001180442F|nr:DUF1366 domain-containing protein [Streptococcus lutetiensis]